MNIIYDPSNLKRADKEKEKDFFIDGDKERIAQVVSNILDNAIKFVEEGTVFVSIVADDTTTSSNNDSVVGNSLKEIIINIKDSGSGIDHAILPRLFSKYSFKDGTGGTGLGLYICKNIVEAHGGRIWAENNKDGKGVTVSLSLPTKQY
ncbi:MAG: ATP-binding protein [Nitrosopumilus sp.]|nr:ATP-binding protein [Nitrosopumilus sp.]